MPLSFSLMSERLTALRGELKRLKLDGFLLPVGDEFLSEYPPESARRVAWLCGFDGSAGTLVITERDAALVTDGRYTLQASRQLPESLYQVINSGDQTPVFWLLQKLSEVEGRCIGADPMLFSQRQWEKMEEAVAAQAGKLVALSVNPVDGCWQDRPPMPATLLEAHPLEYAGLSSREKRRSICMMMAEKQQDALVVSASDALAWLLNIRARDLPHTPVALAIAVLQRSEEVSEGELALFLNGKRLTSDVSGHLGSSVTVHAPDALAGWLAEHLAGKRVWIDPSLATAGLYQQLSKAPEVRIHAAEDPCQLAKACKNPTEIAGMRQAHAMDALALCRFLAWLDGVDLAHQTVTECDVADRLEAFRSDNPACQGLSFETIAGFAANGAIVHYRAVPETAARLMAGQMLLLDSGGQYRSGTTDVTRTVALGAVSEEAKRHFTLVLKGHIALAMAVFPKGTSGQQLDATARMALWQHGLDFDHGTGHGVGSYLNVHEGPQRISKHMGGTPVPLRPGMVLSNEPGYYREGHYGIRIENLVVVVERPDLSTEKSFYGFDTLTLVPIDRRLILREVLKDDELGWLNSYHQHILKTLAPMLDGETVTWLKQACSPL